MLQQIEPLPHGSQFGPQGESGKHPLPELPGAQPLTQNPLQQMAFGFTS
jgi:hypothetical protein